MHRYLRTQFFPVRLSVSAGHVVVPRDFGAQGPYRQSNESACFRNREHGTRAGKPAHPPERVAASAAEVGV